MLAAEVWATFLAERGPRPSAAEDDERDTAERLGEGVAAALEAHPGLSLGPRDFVAHLARLARAGAITERDLMTLQYREVYLAACCASRDARAIARLEAMHFVVIDEVAARFSNPAMDREELRQIVRERLLVAEGDTARIAAFVGRGPLQQWLRVSATRAALNARRGAKEPPLDEKVLATLTDSQHDLELDYLKERYRKEFKEAFGTAMTSLEPRARALLRYAFADGLEPAQIGAIYDVHRTTAGRWLAEARAALGNALRRALKDRLRVGSTELESIWRIVESQLDLSFERYFRAPPPVALSDSA